MQRIVSVRGRLPDPRPESGRIIAPATVSPFYRLPVKAIRAARAIPRRGDRG